MTEKELQKKCVALLEDLENLEKNKIPEFVEDILEIQRLQTLTDKGWQTISYILLVAYGGPTIYINGVDKVIEGYWGGEKVTIPFSEKARKNWQEVEDYLDEIFEET